MKKFVCFDDYSIKPFEVIEETSIDFLFSRDTGPFSVLKECNHVFDTWEQANNQFLSSLRKKRGEATKRRDSANRRVDSLSTDIVELELRLVPLEYINVN